MEWMDTATAWFNEYWPIITTSVIMIGGVVTSVYLVYTKAKDMIQPVLEWIKEKKDGEPVEKVKEDISAKLQSATLATQITDLEEKLNNPTISDAGKQAYMTQLKILYEVKAKLDAGTAVVEETTKTY